MKKIISIGACAVGLVCLISMIAAISDAGAQNKKSETTASEQQYQQPGQPLYFEPEKAKGKGIDDAAPYSDPWYGKEGYKGGHGAHPGTPGDVTDEPQQKIIEGPVRYERVGDKPIAPEVPQQ